MWGVGGGGTGHGERGEGLVGARGVLLRVADEDAAEVVAAREGLGEACGCAVGEGGGEGVVAQGYGQARGEDFGVGVVGPLELGALGFDAKVGVGKIGMGNEAGGL